MISLIPRELMVEMLKECREQFAFYAKNHRAKAEGLLEGQARNAAISKAAVNAEFVRRIDRLIGEPGPTKLPDNLAGTEAVDQDERRAEGGI